MTYAQYRKDLIQGYYDYQLETLMSGFNPHRKTVILLPGGMGSQLERSEHQYPASPNVINDTIWIDPGLLPPWHDALKLEIDDKGRDIDAHVVAAHGPLSVITQTPYDELEESAWDNDWNYGVFGFDWRRPVTESSNYFKQFILKFRNRVVGIYGRRNDPIPNLTIVCHSMGGLVCTHALRNASFSGLGFHAILTIATPFYGTSTQQDRYFIGVDLLKKLFYDAEDIVRIVASLPGPYTLMFLPKAIFDRDGPRIGLDAYPQYDPNLNTPADPFDPAMMRRWPAVVRDHRRHIAGSRAEMIEIASPINSNIAPRFFNVRSSRDTATAVELQWDNIDGDTIDPERGPSPLAGVAGSGDGTVPAWSAYHAYCGNRIELTQAKDHGTLLEHDEVLSLIKSIVETGKASKRSTAHRPRAGGAPAVAAKRDVARAVKDWAKRAKRKQQPPPALFEQPVKRGILSALIGGDKPRMTKARPRAVRTQAAPIPAKPARRPTKRARRA